jgi:hypothetical protein
VAAVGMLVVDLVGVVEWILGGGGGGEWRDV